MADVNHVILIGRLTRDAELKYTAGGQAVCKFSIAVNRRRKQNDQWVEEANFFDIVLWGRSGEAINQYLVKGKQVAVEGELRQDRWEQDGQNRSKVEIMANNVQLLGGGSGAGPGGYSNGQPSQERRSGPLPRVPSSGGGEDGGDEGFADDIPF
jgi:single-strand DNA-binding protein